MEEKRNLDEELRAAKVAVKLAKRDLRKAKEALDLADTAVEESKEEQVRLGKEVEKRQAELKELQVALQKELDNKEGFDEELEESLTDLHDANDKLDDAQQRLEASIETALASAEVVVDLQKMNLEQDLWLAEEGHSEEKVKQFPSHIACLQ